MSRLLLAWALFASVAAAGIEAPLGPYARPGIPLPIRADEAGDGDVGGWPYRFGEGWTVVHVPALPCRIRSGGSELVMKEVPEGVRLVGVVGSLPPVTIPGLLAVEIRLDGAEMKYGRCFDVFDRVVVAPDAGLARPAELALVHWFRSGGDLVIIGPPTGETGGEPGNPRRARTVQEALKLAPQEVVFPRPDNGGREFYDLVRAPQGQEPAAGSARWIVLGASLTMALQILLAARGWIGGRALLSGLMTVALLAGVLSAARPRAEFVPLAVGEFVVVYRGGEFSRAERYRIYVATGPGAEVERDPAAVPCFYRSPGDPWWSAAEGPIQIPRDQQRLVRVAATQFRMHTGTPWGQVPEETRRSRALRRLLSKLAPVGWEVVAFDGIGAPRPAAGKIPSLLRVELAPVR